MATLKEKRDSIRRQLGKTVNVVTATRDTAAEKAAQARTDVAQKRAAQVKRGPSAADIARLRAKRNAQ